MALTKEQAVVFGRFRSWLDLHGKNPTVENVQPLLPSLLTWYTKHRDCEPGLADRFNGAGSKKDAALCFNLVVGNFPDLWHRRLAQWQALPASAQTPSMDMATLDTQSLFGGSSSPSPRVIAPFGAFAQGYEAKPQTSVPRSTPLAPSSPPRPSPLTAQPPRPSSPPTRPASPAFAPSSFGAAATRRPAPQAAPTPARPAPVASTSPRPQQAVPRMPAPLPPFELPASLTQARGGVSMSLGGNAAPTEFLGESDDDPLIPIDAAQAIREGTAFLGEARRTGQVDLQLLLGLIVDAEVRAELAMRHNVILIDGLDDATADRFGTFLEDARALADGCGVSFDQIETMKREYSARLEAEIRRRQGY